MSFFFFIIFFIGVSLLLYTHSIKKTRSAEKKMIKAIYNNLEKKLDLKTTESLNEEIFFVREINGVILNIKKNTYDFSFKISTNNFLEYNTFQIKSSAPDDYRDLFFNALWTPQIIGKTRSLRDAINKNEIKLLVNKNYITIVKEYEFYPDTYYPTLNKIEKISNALVSYIEQFTIICQKDTNIKDIRTRLQNNINSSNDIEFRITNLNSLIEFYEIDDNIDLFFKKLLKDNQNIIKIMAANNLKNQQESLHSLMQILEENTNLKNEEILKIIKLLKIKNSPDSIPGLIKLFEENYNAKIREQILKFFIQMQNPKVNKLLLKLLKNIKPIFLNSAGPYSLLLIEAIGVCGNNNFIESLYILKKSSTNYTTRRAIKTAITQIQSRLGSAEKGWISLSKTDIKKGGLSKASQTPEGALSKPKIKSKRNKTKN